MGGWSRWARTPGASLRCSPWASTARRSTSAGRTPAHLDEIRAFLPLLADGSLQPVIDSVYPLENAGTPNAGSRDALPGQPTDVRAISRPYFEDVHEVVADPRGSPGRVSSAVARHQGTSRPGEIVRRDGQPEHVAQRGLLTGDLTEGKVARLRPETPDDRRRPAGRFESGSILVRAFALPVPSLVICGQQGADGRIARHTGGAVWLRDDGRHTDRKRRMTTRGSAPNEAVRRTTQPVCRSAQETGCRRTWRRSRCRRVHQAGRPRGSRHCGRRTARG